MEIEYKMIEHSMHEKSIEFAWNYHKEKYNIEMHDEARFKNMTKYNLFDGTERHFCALLNGEIIGVLSLTKNKVNYTYAISNEIKDNLIEKATSFCLAIYENEILFDLEIDIEDLKIKKKLIKKDKNYKYEIRR